jgi:hypothetical protein
LSYKSTHFTYSYDPGGPRVGERKSGFRSPRPENGLSGKKLNWQTTKVYLGRGDDVDRSRRVSMWTSHNHACEPHLLRGSDAGSPGMSFFDAEPEAN